jgi:hypothetical protein
MMRTGSRALGLHAENRATVKPAHVFCSCGLGRDPVAAVEQKKGKQFRYPYHFITNKNPSLAYAPVHTQANDRSIISFMSNI